MYSLPRRVFHTVGVIVDDCSSVTAYGDLLILYRCASVIWSAGYGLVAAFVISVSVWHFHVASTFLAGVSFYHCLAVLLFEYAVQVRLCRW